MSLGFGFSLPATFNYASSAFSPLSLFSGGAPGAWYDPSDYGATGTLFQDSAGTTPVTAVEQPVGLMLDKSQGLVLGANLATNSFPVTYSSTQPAGSMSSAVAGTWYELTYTVTARSGAGNLYVSEIFNPWSFTTFGNTVGTYRYLIYAQDAGAGSAFYFDAGAGGSITFGSIAVRQLPGNHAFQATSASRPVLSARYNLLTKTEQFYITGSPWFASGFSTSSTANNLIPSTSSVAHTWGQGPTAPTTVGTALVAKLWIKPNGYNTAVMQLGGCTGTPTAFFNASTGVITGQTGSPAATMVLQPDGYYECTINGVASSTTPGLVSYVVALDNTTLVFAGDGTSGLLYQKASVVPSNQSTLPYQRVNTATDYDTTGFLPYLKFDGVDDSLSTNSISFTATDKMSVFAGVRKLDNTANNNMIVELSSDLGAATGVFNLYASNDRFRYGLKQSAVAVYDATTYNSPITVATSVIYDMAGAAIAQEVFPRINGAVPTLTVAAAGPAGTGNFGNYPLYIGRRGGTSLPLNGQLYSMIIVGKAVTAGELSSTETFVATKTGVVLPVETFDFITTDAGDQIVTDDGDSVITDTYFA